MSGRAYRNYLLGVLITIAAFSRADQVAMGVAMQSIKGSLHLSDTELGLLTGFAFWALQALGAIPIARWIDCGNRVRALGVTTLIWSVMVALTGRATNFAQLLLARVGVGIGEAGVFPAAQSLIPDYFARAERPRASAMFLMEWPIALGLGFFVGGWLNEFLGWRAMFEILSTLGCALPALAWVTLKEPRVKEFAGPSSPLVSSSPCTQPSVSEVIGTLWRIATYRNLVLCYAVNTLFSVGVFQWQPVFLMRSFGLKSGEVGTWLALCLGTGSAVSVYAGGALASRYAGDNERLQLRVCAAGYLFFGLDHILAYLSPSAPLSFVLLGIGNFLSAVGGPTFAVIQTLVPPRMRAFAYAVIAVIPTLIGAGLGPLAVGALSDALHRLVGQESLRYALLTLCPGFAWGAWYMWRASATVMLDLAPMRDHHGNLVEGEHGCEEVGFEMSKETPHRQR